MVTGTISWSTNPTIAINTNGGRIVNVGNATTITDALTAQFADGRYVNVVDSNPKTITAPITFASPNPPISGAVPTAANHLANKSYVDSKVATSSGPKFLATNYLFFNGASQPAWTTVDATLAGVPLGATAIIVYARGTSTFHIPGPSPDRTVFLRVDLSGNTYELLYVYNAIAFSTTITQSAQNQGTYPLRPDGTFDYITGGGGSWESGCQLYIVGYYL